MPHGEIGRVTLMTIADDELGTPPPEEPRKGRTAEGSAQSRRNAVRDGCRSRTEFPEDMQALIDIRLAELTAEEKPKTALERTLLGEIARSGVQAEVCHRKLLVNIKVMRETVDEWWDDDRRQAANTLAARLAKDPGRVAQRLEASLHGAFWCLEQWRGLGASAAHNGSLTEAQRELCCDLMGIGPLLRDNPEKVPARDDQPAIVELVAQQVQRLENQVEAVLKARDQMARSNVREGRSDPQDPESRRHCSNESRAHKRWTWAHDAFQALRRGVSPSRIIDPLTGQPLQPEAAAPPKASAPPPPTAAGPSPQVTEPPAADFPPDDPAEPRTENRIPVPDHLSREDKEILWLMGATLGPMLRAGMVKLPTMPGGPAADSASQPPQT
jgi:hypothetical protein